MRYTEVSKRLNLKDLWRTAGSTLPGARARTSEGLYLLYKRTHPLESEDISMALSDFVRYHIHWQGWQRQGNINLMIIN